MAREDEDTDYADATNHRHANTSSNLQEYWNEACKSWANYNTKCRRRKPEGLEMDFPRVPTVQLKLKNDPDLWSRTILESFPSGFRIVAVHLFAGGIWINDGTLTAEQVKERRKFQMRALFHLVDYWNTKDLEQGNDAPTTIYAGDYNTGNMEDLKAVLQPATDYGVTLWCPVSGPKSLCKSAEVALPPSQNPSHAKGQLDTFVVDLHSPRADLGEATRTLPHLSTARVLKQEKIKGIPKTCGGEGCNSESAAKMQDII